MKMIPWYQGIPASVPLWTMYLFCFAYPPCENTSSPFSTDIQEGSCIALSSQHYNLNSVLRFDGSFPPPRLTSDCQYCPAVL